MFSRVTKHESNQGRASVSVGAQNAGGSPRNAMTTKATKLLTSMVALGILCLALLILAAPHLGFRLLTVTGGSMGSALPVGSVAVVKSVVVSEITAGDVVAYQRSSEHSSVVTHRVVEVLNQDGQISFVTAGDNNAHTDSYPVPAANVIGKVWFHVALAGYLVNFIRQPIGYVLLVGLPALIIILYELRRVRNSSVWLDRQNRRRI
jgi:signal peptidase I